MENSNKAKTKQRAEFGMCGGSMGILMTSVPRPEYKKPSFVLRIKEDIISLINSDFYWSFRMYGCPFRQNLVSDGRTKQIFL